MKRQVYLIAEAEEDIFDIYRYVLSSESLQRADLLFKRIEEACGSLGHLPHRGHVPPELERIGVCDFLEIHSKPYRIIYQVVGKRVFIHCVLDGRRDIHQLLHHRLIR